VAETSRAEPLLLLDDVSSELDPTRTGAVYDFVRQSQSQVFVTTTRPDLFVTPTLSLGERHDFVLRDGRFA
jgi:DNA replication and repair protein RecF